MEDKRKQGQNRYKCSIANCEENGRKFGSLGKLIIAYCPQHRKIGEKIMNYLFDSKKRYFRTKLLYKCKHSLLFENEPKFCEECEQKLNEFLNKAIEAIDKDKEFIEYDEVEIKESDV